MRALVPPKQLLVFDVKEGWAPLCKFLQLPVPDVPFPNINDANEIRLYHNNEHDMNSMTFCRTHRVPTLPLLFPPGSPPPSPVTKQTHQYHQYFHDLSVAINILYIAGKLRTLSIIS